MKLFSKASAYRGQKRHSPTIASFSFLATDQTLSRPDRKKKKKQEKLGEIVRYLRLQSVGNVFEISALFFKSGDSGFQTLGFLLHGKHIKHKLKTIQTRSSMRNSYIQVK